MKPFIFMQVINPLTTHKVSNERGCTIRNRDHSQDKSQSLTTLQSEVTELLGNIPGFNLFVENIFNKNNAIYGIIYSF